MWTGKILLSPSLFIAQWQSTYWTKAVQQQLPLKKSIKPIRINSYYNIHLPARIWSEFFFFGVYNSIFYCWKHHPQRKRWLLLQPSSLSPTIFIYVATHQWRIGQLCPCFSPSYSLSLYISNPLFPAPKEHLQQPPSCILVRVFVFFCVKVITFLVFRAHLIYVFCL